MADITKIKVGSSDYNIKDAALTTALQNTTTTINSKIDNKGMIYINQHVNSKWNNSTMSFTAGYRTFIYVKDIGSGGFEGVYKLNSAGSFEGPYFGTNSQGQAFQDPATAGKYLVELFPTNTAPVGSVVAILTSSVTGSSNTITVNKASGVSWVKNYGF